MPPPGHGYGPGRAVAGLADRQTAVELTEVFEGARVVLIVSGPEAAACL